MGYCELGYENTFVCDYFGPAICRSDGRVVCDMDTKNICVVCFRIWWSHERQILCRGCNESRENKM